jgi:hypothetical protein
MVESLSRFGDEHSVMQREQRLRRLEKSTREMERKLTILASTVQGLSTTPRYGLLAELPTVLDNQSEMARKIKELEQLISILAGHFIRSEIEKV